MNQSDYNELLKEIERERQLGRIQQQMMSPGYVSQQQRGVQIPHTRIESVEKEDDNTYVNVILDHADPTYNVGRGGLQGPTVYLTGDAPTVSDYGVTKTEPLLHNCSEYYCSVIRFTIPLDQVPLLICPIVPNQVALLGLPNVNPLLTPLIIGIQYGPPNLPASFFSDNLLYIPENDFPPPLQNQPTQVISPFYYIFAYQTLVTMINNALLIVYTNSGLAGLFPNFVAPYVEFDPISGLFSLVVPNFFTTLIAPATSIPKIYFNIELETFLSSFNVFLNFPPAIHPFGDTFTFVLTPSLHNQFYPPGVVIPTPTSPIGVGALPPAPSFYYRYTQEYSVLEYWTSLRKILIFSNTIPVKNEYVPATNNLATAIAINPTNDSGVNVSYPILTDFVPNISFLAGESRSIAYYVPTSQYRLIDMISTNPLQKIDIRIFWEDRDGNLYPLLLSIFQQASLKIGFFRKTLYKGPGTLIK